MKIRKNLVLKMIGQPYGHSGFISALSRSQPCQGRQTLLASFYNPLLSELETTKVCWTEKAGRYPVKGNAICCVKWYVDLVSHPKVTLSRVNKLRQPQAENSAWFQGFPERN
jgi:hypothetical protein